MATMAAMTHAEQVLHARDHYGFWLDDGPIPDALFLFIPHGTDPQDGLPLYRTRQAWPEEARLWRAGRLDDLARMLALQGLPVRLPPRGVWQRLAAVFGMGA